MAPTIAPANAPVFVDSSFLALRRLRPRSNTADHSSQEGHRTTDLDGFKYFVHGDDSKSTLY